MSAVPRLKFTALMKRVMPPWLRRTVGGALLESIGEATELVLVRTAQSVQIRFPGYVVGDLTGFEALGAIGRERRIRRGPLEAEASYARRLRRWLDDHRTRGGPYALLRQLYAFFLDTLDVRMDVVYQSGTRRWIDEDGVITRDSISWSGHGDPAAWAHVWLFFYLDAAPVVSLTTLDGGALTTLDGTLLVTLGGTTLLSVDAAVAAEILKAIPREWSAAHIPYITIVLLFPGAELWGYPQPVGTWADDDPEPGQVWQPTDPVILRSE